MRSSVYKSRRAANRVWDLAERYAGRTGLGPEENPETRISDLICDLLHLAVIQGADWQDVAATAISHLRAELIEPDAAMSPLANTPQNAERLAEFLEIGVEEAAKRLTHSDAVPLVKKLLEWERPLTG